MRVAVIGARRKREGTGPYIAAFLARAGADVCAVLGTSPLSARKAAEDFRLATRKETRAYHQADRLFETEALDALVIAAPNETHLGYLERALEAGLHVLCEKPLVWGVPDALAEAKRIAHGFRDAGLVLRLNAQWPETLATYRRLFPETPDIPGRFEMHMAPSSSGVAMLIDSLPHPLSVLAALAPDPAARLNAPEASRHGDGWDLRFGYVADLGRIDCRIVLQRSVRPPRPAAYGLDGRMAHRRLTLEPYTMHLEGGGRSIPLPDPTPLLVRSFLAAVASNDPPGIDFAALPGMEHLTTLVDVARRVPDPSDPDPDTDGRP